MRLRGHDRYTTSGQAGDVTGSGTRLGDVIVRCGCRNVTSILPAARSTGSCDRTAPSGRTCTCVCVCVRARAFVCVCVAVAVAVSVFVLGSLQRLAIFGLVQSPVYFSRFV